MSTSTAVDRAALWIDSLRRRYPLLLEELAPGTGRTFREVRGGGPTASTVAPVRLYVSDALRDIGDGVVELEEAVRDRLGLRRISSAPVPVRLRRLAELLDVLRDKDMPDLAAHVEEESRRMANRCARALGDPEQLVRLPGRCPACDSVSLRAFPERGVAMCVNPPCRHVLDDGVLDEETGDAA
ncbi:hypothetical protein DEJ48_20325 [Streptomyces venezuelae]|uniref:Uncharacterized protein n=1 Tax=Streptomyces venezuelae TaxID=54571 RepID=A0A5P2BY81_STRVZ|nr:hypothetical protein [Streptomyces venezuelae]QES35462.1 hypothetical protein DEJ48_20325 [Streptomyces venezuelae]